MASDIHILAHWRIRISSILWFVAGLGFLLALPILLQATAWALPAVVLLAALLALPLAWATQRLLRHHSAFARLWSKWSLALLFLMATLLAAPVYYLAGVTQLRPALVPQAILTNGEKVIVFQGMQHVGIERFYKSVVYDLEDALSRGYILYYEGVRPSTPEADAWLNQTVTGGRDLSQAYRALGGLCGLQFQNDYFALLGRDARLHPQSHVVADVTTLDLKREYDRLFALNPGFAKATHRASGGGGSSPDQMESIVRFLKQGSEGQRALAGILCRGFMTLSLRRADTIGASDPLDPVILDFRNKQLAARLLAEPRRHIYLTYGAKHLPGLLGLLKTQDPRWHIVSVKWLRTIDAPEQFHGSLAL